MHEHELEFHGPAPVPSSIAEHPLFKDKYKGRKAELFRLSAGILDQAIDRWLSWMPELTKTEEMGLSEANPGMYVRGEDTIRVFYKSMHPDEVFEDGGMFEGISEGLRNSVEQNLSELREEWKVKKKGVMDDPQNWYERFLYLSSRLGLDEEKFLLEQWEGAFDLMAKVLETIAVLHLEETGQEISPHDFEEIANASFPLVEKLAKVKTESGKTNFTNTSLGGRYYENAPKTGYFQFETKDGITSMTLSTFGQFLYDQDGKSKDGMPFSHFFVKVNGISPAEKLWHWMTEFIRQEGYTDELVSWQIVDRIEKARQNSSKVISSEATT